MFLRFHFVVHNITKTIREKDTTRLILCFVCSLVLTNFPMYFSWRKILLIYLLFTIVSFIPFFASLALSFSKCSNLLSCVPDKLIVLIVSLKTNIYFVLDIIFCGTVLWSVNKSWRQHCLLNNWLTLFFRILLFHEKLPIIYHEIFFSLSQLWLLISMVATLWLTRTNDSSVVN